MSQPRLAQRAQWLIARHADKQVEVLTIGSGDEEALPVFSFEEEAEMFLRLQACTSGEDWKVRETSTGEHVDLDAGTVRVRRTVWGGVVSPPKTAAGNRTIRLTGMAVAALKEHRFAAAKQRIVEWVFPSRAGTPLSVHNVHNRSWKLILERAGLPASTRMHDLRHTCATLLLSRGMPVKVVSEMLGHGDVAITLSVYQSVLPDMQESAARVVEEVLSVDRDGLTED